MFAIAKEIINLLTSYYGHRVHNLYKSGKRLFN